MNEYLSLIVGSVGIMASFCTFGFFLDNKLRKSSKATLYGVMNRKIFDNSHSSTQFREILDRLFDVNDKGMPKKWRSLIASYIVFSIAAIIWAVAYPGRASDLPMRLPTTMIGLAALAFLFNPIGDYFSLWQTRTFVRCMESVGRAKYIAFVVADLVMTIMIFLIMVAIWLLFLRVLTSLIGYMPGTFFYYFQIMCRYTRLCTDLGMIMTEASTLDDIFFILFCTTLFTSAWLWVFVAGVLLWPLFRWLNRVFEVEKHPIGTLMAIGGLVIGPVILVFGALAVTYF